MLITTLFNEPKVEDEVRQSNMVLDELTFVIIDTRY